MTVMFLCLVIFEQKCETLCFKRASVEPGGKSSVFKMRFSAIFVLVLVCALVVDAHFHQVRIQFDYVACF